MTNFAKMSPVTVADLLFIRDGAQVLDLPQVTKNWHVSRLQWLDFVTVTGRADNCVGVLPKICGVLLGANECSA